MSGITQGGLWNICEDPPLEEHGFFHIVRYEFKPIKLRSEGPSLICSKGWNTNTHRLGILKPSCQLKAGFWAQAIYLLFSQHRLYSSLGEPAHPPPHSPPASPAKGGITYSRACPARPLGPFETPMAFKAPLMNGPDRKSLPRRPGVLQANHVYM